MAENEQIEPKIHITPDAQTLEKLSALRKDGETYSDLVRRLTEEQIADRLVYGDAVFHVKLVPKLREAIDAVRWAGESHADTIMRTVEAYQHAEDVRVGKLTPDLREKLDAIRGEEEAYASVIHRLIQMGAQGAAQTPDFSRGISPPPPFRDESKDLSTMASPSSLCRHGLCRINACGDVQQNVDEPGSPNRREEGSSAGCLALQSGEEVTRAMRVKPSTYTRIESMVQGAESYDEVVTRLLDERFMYRLIAKNMAAEGRRLSHNQGAIIHNFKLVIKDLVTIDAVAAREGNCDVQQDVDELLADMMSTPPDEGDSE